MRQPAVRTVGVLLQVLHELGFCRTTAVSKVRHDVERLVIAKTHGLDPLLVIYRLGTKAGRREWHGQRSLAVVATRVSV